MTLVNLFAAIYKNDIEQIKNILTNEPLLVNTVFKNPEKEPHAFTKELYQLCDESRQLDDPNYKEETALLFAARLGRKEVCELLINEFKADVNTTNTYGYNAFMSAIDNKTDVNFDTALMILDNPALNLQHTTYGKYDALGQLLRSLQHFDPRGDLSAAKAQAVIDALLDKGFDLNKPQGKSGETAFLLACHAHSWIVVVYLIARGADYSVKNNYLHYERDMYLALSMNQYLPPKAKEEVLSLLENVITAVGSPYGEYKRPEHLYIDFDGEPMEFDTKRFG